MIAPVGVAPNVVSVVNPVISTVDFDVKRVDWSSQCDFKLPAAC